MSSKNLNLACAKVNDFVETKNIFPKSSVNTSSRLSRDHSRSVIKVLVYDAIDHGIHLEPCRIDVDSESHEDSSLASLLQRYVENVKQDASIGTNILRVSASDEDADNNGAIVYSLSSPSNEQNLEYFEIQPESGWIVLKKPLDVSIASN